MNDKYLWVESYAPQKVSDCILPNDVKETFKQYVKESEFPNLILAGPAGVGKTSLAKALCDEIGADILFVNASLDRGIGDVRTTVAQFASSSSLLGSKKVVLLDEADNLTGDSQKALRALIESFQNHCRFILTCNYPHNIIEAIHSRCNVVDFNIRDPKVLQQISGEFFVRCKGILDKNEIVYEDAILAKFIKEMAPDWRGTLNNLQGKTKGGKLDKDILKVSAVTLMPLLKAKKWNDVRDWVFENSFVHPKQIERSVYRALQDALVETSRPQCTLIFGEYSHRILAGADPSITLLAMITQVMVECEFK